jgi:hypothetical protein
MQEPGFDNVAENLELESRAYAHDIITVLLSARDAANPDGANGRTKRESS